MIFDFQYEKICIYICDIWYMYQCGNDGPCYLRNNVSKRSCSDSIRVGDRMCRQTTDRDVRCQTFLDEYSTSCVKFKVYIKHMPKLGFLRPLQRACEIFCVRAILTLLAGTKKFPHLAGLPRCEARDCWEGFFLFLFLGVSGVPFFVVVNHMWLAICCFFFVIKTHGFNQLCSPFNFS